MSYAITSKSSVNADVWRWWHENRGRAVSQHQAAHSGPRRGIVLAAEWRQLTGLPFVFAVWAWRPSNDDEERAFLLRRSLERGLDRLDEIADESGFAGARRYLRHNLCFRLDDDLLAGANEFLARG